MKYSYAIIDGVVKSGIYALLPTCCPNMDCSCGECKDPKSRGSFHLVNGVYHDIWLCTDCIIELGLRTLTTNPELILVRVVGGAVTLDNLAQKLSELPSIVIGELDYVKHLQYSGVIRFYVKETISIAGLLSFFSNIPVSVECWYKGEQFNLKKNTIKEAILKGEVK